MNIEVEAGRAERAGRLDTLVTHDVYTCLLLALRIRRIGTGFMGHFVMSLDSLEQIERVAQNAAEEAGQAGLITARLRGSAPLYDVYDPDEVAAVRGGARDILEHQGITNIDELWLPEDTLAIPTARLDCANARFTAPHVR